MKSRTDRWLLGAVALIGTLYLIQLPGPLRIDNDAVAYLLVAIDLADGVPSDRGLPLGYPWMVAVLDRAGIASGPSIVFLNIVFVAIGLAAFWYIARDRSVSIRAGATALTLLAYPMIRETMHPHPEAVYFGISLTALALITAIGSEQRTDRNFFLMASAAGLIMIGVTFRIVAIALVAPLLWSLYQAVKPREPRGLRRVAVVAGATMAVVAALGIALALSEGGTLARYLSDATARLNETLVDQLFTGVEGTLRGSAELSVNLPLSRSAFIRPLVAWVGIPAMVLFVSHFRKMGLGGAAGVYVGAYMLMLFAWPFFAVRLWIPIIPLVFLFALTGASPALSRTGGSALGRFLVRSWAVWITAVGFAALVYTTRISYAGEDFRHRYGRNGGLASPGHENSAHNADARTVVSRYDAKNPAWRWLLDSADTRP